MKKLTICILILIVNSQIFSEECNTKAPKQNCQEDDNDPATSEILQTFAGVIVNFGKVVADPNNPQNVSEKVANMVAGMINIAAIMTKSPPIRDKRINQIFKSMDPEIIRLLEKIVKTEAEKLTQKSFAPKY